jgi:hypothetical protein
VLLSLVFPGLGQLANGRPWRALGFAGATLLPLVVLLRRLWTATLERTAEEPDALLDPALWLRLASEIQQANASFISWASLALVGIGIVCILDAWLDAGPPAGRPRPSRPE